MKGVRELGELWAAFIRDLNELDQILPMALYVYPENRGKLAKEVYPEIENVVGEAKRVLEKMKRDLASDIERWAKIVGVDASRYVKEVERVISEVEEEVKSLPDLRIEEVSPRCEELSRELFSAIHRIWLEMRRVTMEKIKAPPPVSAKAPGVALARIVKAEVVPKVSEKPVVTLRMMIEGTTPEKVEIEVFDNGTKVCSKLVDLRKEHAVALEVPLLDRLGVHELRVVMRSLPGEVKVEQEKRLYVVYKKVEVPRPRARPKPVPVPRQRAFIFVL